MRPLCVLAILVWSSVVMAEPTISIIDVQHRDASGYVVRAQDSFDAVKDKGGELAACTKGYKLDIKQPVRAVLGKAVLQIGATGKAKLLAHPNATPLDQCVARVVQRWTFPDRGELTVRAGITAPVERDPKLSTKYIESLQAVCDAVGSDMQDTVERVRKALAAHPDPDVERFIRTMSGRFPSERDVLFGAVLANAGITSCPLRALK